jgi:hypothetical protein
MTWRRAAVLATMVATGSVACRQILGLTGEGVVSDAGVDAGGHADAGSDADAKSSPPKCGLDLPTDASAFQAIVKACVLAVSCDPEAFPFGGGVYQRASDCISNDTVDEFQEYRCLKTITDCAGFTACTGTLAATASQCPTPESPSSCSGATAVNCGPGLADASNGVGIACDTELAQGCGTYETNGSTGTACLVLDSCTDPTDGTFHCAGNVLYTCVQGKGIGLNCTFFDSTCAVDPTDPEAGPNCNDNGAGTSCDASDNTAFCLNGATLQTCVAHVAYDINCGAVGTACVPNADNSGVTECVAPGCTFGQTATFNESCAGSVANLYIGGAPYAFDCRTLGGTFSTCASFEIPGATYVYCR